MNFLDVLYLQSGATFGIPEFSVQFTAPDKFLIRMQGDIVLRIVGYTGDAYCVVTLTVGGESAAVTVRFNVSNTQYLPLNDILAAMYERKFPSTLPASLALSGTAATLEVETFNASDASTGADRFSLYICDSGGHPALFGGYPFSHVLPDSFLLMKDTHYDACFVSRAVDGVQGFRIINSLGGTIDSYDNGAVNGASVKASIRYNATPSNLPSYVAADDSLGNEVERAHVEYIDGCSGDTVQLTWWSNVDGGYKSRAAKVRRHAARIVTQQEYLHVFSDVVGKRTAGGLSFVFENLTPRDMAYYCDLIASDEVYVYYRAISAVGVVRRVPVTVRGDFPTFDAVKNADLPFDIEFLKTDNM